jgi:hypothetical protein
MPWARLVALIEPVYPNGGRVPFPIETMLRIPLHAAEVCPLRPGDGRGTA